MLFFFSVAVGESLNVLCAFVSCKRRIFNSEIHLNDTCLSLSFILSLSLLLHIIVIVVNWIIKYKEFALIFYFLFQLKKINEKFKKKIPKAKVRMLRLTEFQCITICFVVPNFKAYCFSNETKNAATGA